MINNTVLLSGHLGAHPEARQFASDRSVTNVNLAVRKSYKDASGNYVDDTQWFRLKAWGRTGEQMVQRLSKGDRVLITGELECRTYETKAGEKRESVEIVVTEFEKLQRYSERKALVELVVDKNGHLSGVEHDGADDSGLPF